MTSPVSVPVHVHFAAWHSRRGGTLLLAMIVAFFVTITCGLLIHATTQSNRANYRSLRKSACTNVAQNLLQYAAETLRQRLGAVTAKAPDAELREFSPGLPANVSATLGVDTNRYELVSAEWFVDGEPVFAPGPFAINSYKDPALTGPLDGRVLSGIWAVPVRVRVALRERSAAVGDTVATTVRATLRMAEAPLLQHMYYINGYENQFEFGKPMKIKGKVFSNNRLNIWCWAGTGTSNAAVQLSAVEAPFVNFNNLKDGPRGSSNHYNGIYISAGDLNRDNRVTYFAKQTDPLTSPFNPYDPDSAKADFIPAFQTLADTGQTSVFANYFKSLAPSLYSANSGDNTDAKDPQRRMYFKIDSGNPNLASLAARYNGNFKDSSTGFAASYPESLPPSLRAGSARPIIEPPSSTPPAGVDAEEAKAIEAAKFANQANFYVLVENPGSPGVQPLPPVVFDSSASAMAYKKASAGLTDLQKLELRGSKEFSDKIIVVPASVIQVQRSFYDMSQKRAGGSDPVKSIRVSAVDVDMGELRAALGTKSAPGSLKTAAGQPYEAAKKWNGVVYIDVADPKGNAWVSNGSAASGTAAPRLAYDKTLDPSNEADKQVLKVTAGNASIPSDYTYTGKPLAGGVKDPLNTASEETLVAVRLYNASKIPDLAGVDGYTGKAGLTLATNTAVYTVGHVNADGDPVTDRALNARDSSFADAAATKKEAETTPMAIACDSHTAFSNSYYYGDATAKNLDTADSFLSRPTNRLTSPSATFLEANYALISGGADRSISGKYANSALNPAFPQNIPVSENRTALKLRYRGSRNLLFQSKYNTKYYNNEGGSYEADTDDAFDNLYREGNQNIPAGLPGLQIFMLGDIRYDSAN